MQLTNDEKIVIINALQELWDLRDLDFLCRNDDGEYYDNDYPQDAKLANIISSLINRLYS